LTPTTHGIQVEKPTPYMFEPTQFTILQLETSDSVDGRPMSLATSPTPSHLEYGVRVSRQASHERSRLCNQGIRSSCNDRWGHYILNTSRPAVLVAGGIGSRR
jgi:predicted ferric reductase